jgi:hypothetical protein
MDNACSFCGKRKREVRKLIGCVGTTVVINPPPAKAAARKMALICDECVELYYEILQSEGH